MIKRSYLLLLGLLLAGCSTAPIHSSTPGPMTQVAPTTYHHEIFTVSGEGDTQFLHLVPDSPQ